MSFSFVSCIVMISALCDWASCSISDVFRCRPFILIWIILMLELGLWLGDE